MDENLSKAPVRRLLQSYRRIGPGWEPWWVTSDGRVLHAFGKEGRAARSADELYVSHETRRKAKEHLMLMTPSNHLETQALQGGSVASGYPPPPAVISGRCDGRKFPPFKVASPASSISCTKLDLLEA